jgi:hypothetical protein
MEEGRMVGASPSPLGQCTGNWLQCYSVTPREYMDRRLADVTDWLYCLNDPGGVPYTTALYTWQDVFAYSLKMPSCTPECAYPSLMTTELGNALEAEG